MSEFRIQSFVLGPVSTNCYLVYHEKTRDAVVVDPADNGPFLVKKCEELGVRPQAILLTHGHFDHILAASDLKRAFSCPIYAGRNEEALLQDPDKNLTGTMGAEPMTMEADVLVKDGEILNLAEFSWQVLETPGHTAGSVCYYIAQENVLIAGDTLFAESLGRTDLPTGSFSAIVHSIAEKLLVLPDDTMVYPGHGEPTTIGHEKQYNPVAAYLRRKS